MSQAAGQLLKRVLMVPPKHFSVEYTINPWMGGVVDKEKAYKQWSSLKEAIEKEGVQVLTMDQTPGLPDQVFVCNSGLVYNNKVYLSKFRHKERTGEQEHYLKWFKSQNFHTFGEDYPEFFEGGGDAVFSDPRTLWAGYGPRSTKGVYDKIKVLGDFETVICELIHPTFYHMDTCFAPVDETTALWYPPAFSDNTKKEIVRRMPHSIAVSDEEAIAFVCNAITVRNTVISPVGVKSATRKALEGRQMAVVEVDMSEFMKSGGACQCLVLRL
uniref:Amidinotransferase n=1 Tax=Angiostrongylus cantonensis TaxID=6313 RepID=A0A0K0DH47_ANGCA